MRRQSRFEEIMYGILALIVFGTFVKFFLLDLNNSSPFYWTINVILIIGFGGMVFFIINKFIEMLKR